MSESWLQVQPGTQLLIYIWRSAAARAERFNILPRRFLAAIFSRQILRVWAANYIENWKEIGQTSFFQREFQILDVLLRFVITALQLPLLIKFPFSHSSVKISKGISDMSESQRRSFIGAPGGSFRFWKTWSASKPKSVESDLGWKIEAKFRTF